MGSTPLRLRTSGLPCSRTSKSSQPPQQHRIIRELCDRLTGFRPEKPEIRRLKLTLATQYRKYDTDTGASRVNDALIEETRHWLDVCPEARKLYNDAIGKFRSNVFQRNVLDDLRLSLEILLKAMFANDRSLENQLPALGQFIKACGGSRELGNMFSKLVEYYYTRYQNTYVKHADDVIEQEIEFVIEITSAFMKHIVRMHAEQTP